MDTLRYLHKARQRGAIAPMTALMLMLILIPMAGLVLDLGHLYIAKAELQNMADAVALAAAKDLDNSGTGVTTAVATGKTFASKNKYDFGSTLTLQDANFEFAATPDGPWYSASDSVTNPTGRTFVKVDTRMSGTSQTFTTYLMGIAGISTTATFGYAVAGRYVNTVTPIGICAIDPTHRTAQYSYSTGITEVVEYGFRRGMAYNVFSLGSLGGAASDPYQINPVDSPGGTGSCKPSNAGANITAPFMCTGNSAILPTGVGQVYTNTGMTASLDRALNSRFNDYSGGSKCDPASAPPDVNIREYPCRDNSSPCQRNIAGTVSVTPPIDWMDTSGNTLPNQQSISTTGSPLLPKYWLPSENSSGPSGAATSPATGRSTMTTATFSEYGSLWAYTPAYRGDGSTPITPAEANAAKAATSPMYGSAPGSYFDTAKYPTTAGSGFATGTVAAPYNQTGNSDYYQAPTGNVGQVDRRILNIVLIDCRTAPSGGGASCGTMNAVGIGKFFMLNKADFSGGTPRLDVEFTGLVEPVPTSEVKLYR